MNQGPTRSLGSTGAAPDGAQEAESEEPSECATCGGRVKAMPCAWNSATSYRCQECGAGGHVTDDGTRHGPALCRGWSL